MNQPPFEVADIIRVAGQSFIEKNRSWLSWQHLRVLRAIERCRTAALGGHLDQCSRCGHQAISYHSCRNRHCAKCQTNARDKWLSVLPAGEGAQPRLSREVHRRAEERELSFPGALQPLAQETAFRSLLRSLFRQDWVVYAKPPFGGPQHVLHYLARYTHRVAISNHRLVALTDGQVTFRWKDYGTTTSSGS
jgi:hypothetical protein